MNESPVVKVWQESSSCQLIVRLEHDGRYVEHPISDEVLEDAISPQAVIRATLEDLCKVWQYRYNTQDLILLPKEEGCHWTVRYNNVIDGEVVEERRAIDAPRKAIQGR